MIGKRNSLLRKAIVDGDIETFNSIVVDGFCIQKLSWDSLRFLAENINYPINYGNKENYEMQKDKYDNQLLILKSMLSHNVRNVEDEFGVTALEIMISKGAIHFVSTILDSGVIPTGNCFREACFNRDFKIFKLLLKVEPNCSKKISRNYLHREHPTDMISSFDLDDNKWNEYKSIEDVEENCTAHPRLYSEIYDLVLNKRIKQKNTNLKLKSMLNEYITELEIFYGFLKNNFPIIDQEQRKKNYEDKEEKFERRLNEKIYKIALDLNFFNIKNNKEAFQFVRDNYEDILDGENYNVMKLLATEAYDKAINELIPNYIEQSINEGKSITNIAASLKTTERKLKNFMNKSGLKM
ncbi:hypothetical protein ACPC5Q_03605 [Acinetobacter junii]|uniref:hypothetical protein n=1 Tax=Acinetobacter junii TaxID=40215 RepID=UPI003C25DD36